MSSDQLSFENASARPLYLDFALPWLGSISLAWNDTRGRSFFDHGYDIHDRASGEHEFWCGPLHVAFYQNYAVRPSRLAWTALACAAVNVAGWTEGHLWRLF